MKARRRRRNQLYLYELLEKMVRNANGGRGVAFHVGELLIQRLRVEETCENIAEGKGQG